MRILLIAFILGLALAYPAHAQYTPPEFKPPSPEADTPIWTPPPDKKNPLDCAAKVLGSKFPFDIFGSPAPGSTPSECPEIAFFKGRYQGFDTGMSFKMCFLLDVVKFLKFPLIIGFLVKSLMSI